MISLFSNLAFGAQLEGERVLDSSNNFATNNYINALEVGLSFVPGGVLVSEVISTVANTLDAQFNNKEQAQNQNIDLDVAKNNLDNSKSNVTSMFFFIVSTFIVLFDMIISIIYIAMLSMIIWIIFVGYAKLMIMIIDFVSGRYKVFKGLK
jgi:hypothetical protein